MPFSEKEQAGPDAKGLPAFSKESNGLWGLWGDDLLFVLL